ncbi:hypothetical protein FPSE5266_04874 [Fusarium pseudograminearum]|nr:hypothetical protein FPSE5266_04874 [Fusarium pseudograminearum]
MAPSSDKNPKRGRSSQRRERNEEESIDIDALQRITADMQRLLQRARNRQANNSRSGSARRGDTLTHDRSVSQSNRGDRDSSTFNHNSTSGQNGQGSSAGVSENTNNTKKCLASVSEVEKREYIGADIKTAQSIVNTNNSRFAAITHSGGISGTTNTLEELSFAGRAIMEHVFERIAFRLEPVTWDNEDIIQAMMQAADAERESTAERYWSRIRRQVEVISEQEPEQCANCAKTSHALGDCLLAHEGWIPGCLFCNTQDHDVDQCRTFLDMCHAQQTRVLVHSRKRMPAMRTAKNWYDYLADYLKRGGNKTPTEFPWSFDFAANKATENQGDTMDALQTTWDASKRVDDLINDPAHSSIDDIGRLYWGGRIWPSNPGELPQTTSARLLGGSAEYAEARANVAARLGGNASGGPKHDTKDEEDEDMIG